MHLPNKLTADRRQLFRALDYFMLVVFILINYNYKGCGGNVCETWVVTCIKSKETVEGMAGSSRWVRSTERALPGR